MFFKNRWIGCQIQHPPHTFDDEQSTQAVAVLDAQFAWLRGAEKPGSQRRTKPTTSAHR